MKRPLPHWHHLLFTLSLDTDVLPPPSPAWGALASAPGEPFLPCTINKYFYYLLLGIVCIYLLRVTIYSSRGWLKCRNCHCCRAVAHAHPTSASKITEYFVRLAKPGVKIRLTPTSTCLLFFAIDAHPVLREVLVSDLSSYTVVVLSEWSA